MTTTVMTKCDNAIRNIILNRPERLNAINPQLLGDFLAALREGNADPQTTVMIISGAGAAFCAGDDLKEFDERRWWHFWTWEWINPVFRILKKV